MYSARSVIMRIFLINYIVMVDNKKLKDDYKRMMDIMLEKEKNGELDFLSEEGFRRSVAGDSELDSE
jgi:hypothetical protein